MNVLSFVISTAVLAAPPPKPMSNSGRITVNVDGRIEHFRPDGTDVTSFALPDFSSIPTTAISIIPDRKSAVYMERTDFVVGSTVIKNRIVVTPLIGQGKPFTLEGYVAVRMIVSPDGSKVVFHGGKNGDEIDAIQPNTSPGFLLDLASKKVTSIPLPEKHEVLSVSPDGQRYLTSHIVRDDNIYSRRTYLVTAGGKSAEVFKENVFVYHTVFSPDGSKVLATALEHTGVKPLGNIGLGIGSSKPREYAVLDVGTKETKKMFILPKDCYVTGLAWSPNGLQIAYVWNDLSRPLIQHGPGPGDVGNVQRVEYEHRVFVADADGGNAKEVHKTKGKYINAFMWK